MIRDIRSKAFRVDPEEAQDWVYSVSCRFLAGDPSLFWFLCIIRMLGPNVVVRSATPCLAASQKWVVPVPHLPGWAWRCRVGWLRGVLVWWGVYFYPFLALKGGSDMAYVIARSRRVFYDNQDHGNN